jgi:hypothetical protein
MLAHYSSWDWSLSVVAGRRDFLGVALRRTGSILSVGHFRSLRSSVILCYVWFRFVGERKDNERWRCVLHVEGQSDVRM